MSNYQLIAGDSAEHIKTIADQSIDLILTDPPYNQGRYSTGNIKMSWRKDFNNDTDLVDNKSVYSIYGMESQWVPV